MYHKSIALLPRLEKVMAAFGDNIRLARLRRKLTAQQVSERAGISRSTLWMIEKGSPSVAMGSYTQTLFALGLEKELLNLASNDELGRKLQDIGLETKKRGPKKK